MPPHPDPATGSVELELARERTYGGAGRLVDRPIPVVDLTAASRRQAQVDAELWSAAADVGFFELVGHGIPAADVDAAFEQSARFFALPAERKARWARPEGSNAGWEFMTQVRPSTGTQDQKESYQVTRPQMGGDRLWPSDADLAGFRATMERFEAANHAVAMQVLASFARTLGFPDGFFTARHDRSSPQHQSTLRLLHYLPLPAERLARLSEGGVWRAGAHTDFDCLTLLHQRPGQPGLQVSRGPGGGSTAAEALEWTPVEPVAGRITCNIGDMLVRWSDDALRSTLHRVRLPRADEPLGPRLSIAYFAQADRDAVISGPTGRSAPIRAGDFLQQRIAANFAV